MQTSRSLKCQNKFYSLPLLGSGMLLVRAIGGCSMEHFKKECIYTYILYLSTLNLPHSFTASLAGIQVT